MSAESEVSVSVSQGAVEAYRREQQFVWSELPCSEDLLLGVPLPQPMIGVGSVAVERRKTRLHSLSV